MSYLVKWDEKAFNFLEKLPKNISERIINKVDKIKENPTRYLEHYEGDYRLLVDIDFTKKVITIQVFDKRGRIYKR